MKKLQRGLPRGRYSKHGYKRNSPDVNKPFNIIPSGNITMKDVDFPVKGIDNLGNEQIMYPGLDYIFPGDYVLELPMMQPGGQYYTPASENTRVNYTPVMTVQAAKKLKAQRDAQELARRKQAIQASQAAASKPLRKRLTPENLAQETGATGDKLRFFPNDPDSFIDEYLNPFKMIGDMASGLGRIPLNIKQGNYGQAAMSVATPLVVGATAGLGAKSAGQFVNNLANPLAGTGQFLTESVGNIFKKKQPLPDWAIAQMRYLSLPELNNPEASEVLENFLIRISTPEGKKRLKELGITNTKVFDNLKIIANKDTYGEYWLNKIALHPELPGVRNVTRHEIEHAVQDALSNSRIDKYNRDFMNLKHLFSLKKADAAYNESLKPTSDIDDILSGLELRKTPQKVDWNAIKSVDKETPLEPDRLFDYLSDKQRATNYFDSGSRGREKSAFLAEVQQYMMDKGTIPKISYMDITPEMVRKTFIDSRFDQENLGKFLRLFNIMKPTENNYELISKGLNKMLSLAPYAVPAAIGAGTYGVNQKQDAQPTMQKFGDNLNFQFGGYIPSWLNPMNWEVTDYTGKKDFNSAYAAARQAGEKEFMWNGKRFNTDYKGTPQQQLKETGLTNEQIQDRSKLNKNLTKNIYPYSYDNLEKRIWAAGVLGKKEENREAIDKDPRPYDKEKLDALNLYAGVPQKNNTFRISNYKPSTSKDNINYYTFNKQDDRFVQNLIDYAYLKSKDAINGSAKGYDIDVKGLVPDQEKNVMGNYKMSTGKDDRGTYVSFYDKWDLAPMDFGKPFEIYDRIYTKDYGDGKQKRMYYTDKELLELDINKKNFDTLALQRELANRGYKLSKSTKKDGIFDGILGEETKKALEDWQKKNFKKQFGGKLPKYQDKGSVQPRKNNKIYSFLGDMIDRAEKATNETSKFLGDILAPITPDYKTEEEREMLFRRHRPVPYPGIVAGLKDIYIDYTNKKTGNPYLDNFIQNYTVEQKKPFLDEKGDYNIAEEAWRMSLGLPVKNKYIKKSNYRPLDEKNKNSKYYTLNNVIDYNALRNKVKELKIKPGNFVQMESLSPFIKDKFMNKEEFAEIDPLQRFKLGVNKKGKMYIWDKYDFNFAPLQKVIEPYQYEFYDEFQNGGMMQRKDLPKAQSLGEFIPSWANPMNWNVEDYSNKTDFNKAYSAAKKAGKKEFMFNGKRYNTKYAGTPRQEVGVYGVQGKPVHHMNLNDPAQVNLYPAFGKYLPGHISASIGDNQTSVDYSRIGNYPYGINKVKNKGEKSFNVYGQDNLTFSNKVASLPTGDYFVEDEYRPSDWNLFTNNCADNVCDAFGIPRSKDIQTPKAAMQKIQKKYPTLDVTGRTYDDYYDLGVKLRPISFHRPDEVLNQTKNLVGILSSPDLNNTKASEKITFALQNALLKKGYKLPKSINKDGELDGILGDETKAALEDWQKKNSKKQLGGALLKAQFGAFGTIPTSPPFMPQKENVVTSKKVDNSPKIKVNTTVPDEMITIKDGRKIRLTTGQAINPNTDLVGKSYPTKTLRSILDTAKNRGLSKDDALTLAAMDLQETRWGETDNNMGHVIYKNGFARSPAENFINAYLKSKETADRLKLSDEYTRLQVYNGLGTVTPDTEKDYHGFRMKKIYGVPVPASGINMRKNPLYGKQIVDIRDNVLKQNPEFLKLVDEYYKMGGVTNEMLDVYKNYINGIYTNTEKEKDAIKIYDKLNRKYYREAKNANKSVPNYIMSLIK